MTDKQFNRLKLSKVCSLEAYSWLQKWIIERHPGNPYPGEPKSYFYRDTSHRMYLSKFIESVIIKVLKSTGASPIKANDAGTYRDTSKTVIDGLGNQRKVGSGTWTKAANVSPGRADVVCFFNGALHNIEVKVGNDKLSTLQLKEMERAVMNGEVFSVVKTIDDFIKLLDVNYLPTPKGY